MLQMDTVVAAQAVTATGTGVEQSASPFLPGTTVVAVIQPAAFSGTFLLEGSDDDSTYSTLVTSGALTTDSEIILTEITLPKFVRHDTTRTAGSVSCYLLNAG